MSGKAIEFEKPESGLALYAIAALIFIVLSLIVFGDLVFGGGNRVVSYAGCDIRTQFAAWRDFAFSQLRNGNFALWNPHLYSGAPFFGGLQSGLLYPLNYQYLFLPLPLAINTGIAFHVALAGMFMFLWARERGLRFLPSLLCGVLWMYCGAHYGHVIGGHPCRLISTTWIPLVFLSIDGVFDREKNRLGYVLLGALAVSMMVFGGDAQYLFHTGFAAAIYSILRLGSEAFKTRKVGEPKPGTPAKALLLILIAGGGAAIGAVQLLTGIAATAESVRGSSAGVPFSFASMFSLPPENFLTFFAPTFFGSEVLTPYWGRGYFWEMCIFVSITGFLLAAYGAATGKNRKFCVMMTIVLFILALGAHTPLFRLLYDFFPGFNRFRGMSKFEVQGSAFLILLSGIGLDALMARDKIRKSFAVWPLTMAVALLAGAAYFYFTASPTSGTLPLSGLIKSVTDSGEAFFLSDRIADLGVVRQAQLHSALSLLLGAVTCAVIGGGIVLMKTPRRLAVFLAVVGMLEMLAFGRLLQTSFDIAEMKPSVVKDFLESHPGDYRVLVPEGADFVMAAGGKNVWGYGPLPPARYGRFIAFSQRQKIDEASPNVQFNSWPAIYKMLRCRYALMAAGWVERGDAMPHAALISKFSVAPERAQILQRLMSAEFDPSKEVILESKPGVEPVLGGNPGTARVVEQETDSLVIEADASAPAILLVTDAYASGWRARSLADGTVYSVMPANYVLRAIPLQAGHHRIKMEYVPPGFVTGRWISIISFACFLLGLGYLILAKIRKPVPAESK